MCAFHMLLLSLHRSTAVVVLEQENISCSRTRYCWGEQCAVPLLYIKLTGVYRLSPQLRMQDSLCKDKHAPSQIPKRDMQNMYILGLILLQQIEP